MKPFYILQAVVILTLFCLDASTMDEYVFENDEVIRQQIENIRQAWENKTTGFPERKALLMVEALHNKFRNHVQQSIMLIFQCAINTIKIILEEVWQKRGIEDINIFSTDVAVRTVKMPNSVIDLINERFSFLQKHQHVIHYNFKKWYAATKLNRSSASYTIQTLQLKLQEHFTSKKDEYKYESLDHLHQLFAGAMAFLFKFAAELHYEVIKKLSRRMTQNAELSFEDALFEELPNWDIPEYFLDLFNLLQGVIDTKPTIIKFYLIPNLHGEKVILPYSKGCGRAKTELPLNF